MNDLIKAKEQARSSRQRYRQFVRDYRQHRLDDGTGNPERARDTADAAATPQQGGSQSGLRGATQNTRPERSGEPFGKQRHDVDREHRYSSTATS